MDLFIFIHLGDSDLDPGLVPPIKYSYECIGGADPVSETLNVNPLLH